MQSFILFKVVELDVFRTCDTLDQEKFKDISCSNSKSLSDDNNDANAVLFSIVTTSINIIFQFGRLVAESNAVEEGISEYALNCVMARVGWTPYKRKIERFREDSDYKVEEIDYDIKYRIYGFTNCTGIRGTVDFAFSDVTLNQLSAAISLLESNDNATTNNNKNNYNYYNEISKRSPIKLFVHHSCDLVPCHEMVSLMWACKDKVQLMDLTHFDWNGSIDLASKDGKDIRIKQYCYIGDRIPILMAILEADFDPKLKIFKTFVRRGMFI